MVTKSMDVFSLREHIVGEYSKFATSFTTIHAEDIRRQVEAIYEQNRYWPEPLIQINPNYKRAKRVDELVDEDVLDATCGKVFRAGGETLSLFKHQEQAIALASAGQSYVVTTGTGSGKSLCFFIPIVDAVLRERRAGGRPRTRAIVIYPMNALANSQLEELDKFMANVSGPRPVTFERYTGQEDQETRRRIADNPPDILLTNFMMLELLMTRQDDIDRQVIANCKGLRFLVLDELHTYRGRQGADVAMLVRRVRERLSPERLQCIGTSATMASEGSLEDKNRVVAAVASKLFSDNIPPNNVVTETLERVTDKNLTIEKLKAELGPAVDAELAPNITDLQLTKHPLAVWVETRLGIAWSDVDHQWVRARPRTVTEAVKMLAEDSGRSLEACAKALQRLLLISGTPEKERTGVEDDNSKAFFAFKLHQFISGAGNAFATLDAPGERKVTVEKQLFLPGEPEKRLYSVHFCRDCGHEYHPVRYDKGEGMVLARDIDDTPPHKAKDEEDLADAHDEQEVFGFLTVHADDSGFDFDDRVEDYPETWCDTDANGVPHKLKSTYRRARAIELRVAPTGKVGSGVKVWFMPGRYRFCLRCGATYSGSARDRNRLASLSAEGRSSATTVLVSSALRWMHGTDSGLDRYTRKLLGFTDNRQDAALQAGHFNDFLFVCLVRAGFLGALEVAGAAGIGAEELGQKQQQSLGFDRPELQVRAEWLLEADLRGFNLQEAESTLRQVLSYRVWFDQRRGWRYTNPNLEQLGLIDVEYRGLDELAADQELFASAPAVLRDAAPAFRAALYRELLDHLRRSMAIRSQVLEKTFLEQVVKRSHARLRAPWGFSGDERPVSGRWLMLTVPQQKKRLSPQDDDLIMRGGSRSLLGRALRASKSSKPREEPLWEDPAVVRKMKARDFDHVIRALLDAATKHGLVSEEGTPFGTATGWRLNEGCVRFRLGTPPTDKRLRSDNAYFRDLYFNLARLLRDPVHPLFGFEAREHTAQVDGEKRAAREKRFRFGAKEQEELQTEDKKLREMGEANRFLPVLFCSPTMELGVDISALNAVYLRNVPPTPANYAQRSGRAGRSGQAALVLTYCSSQGPHDQYFFRDPRAMVHGEVRAPLLDLANRDLVESHLWAVWLACTEQPLDPSIAELLVLNDPDRPLKPDVAAPMRDPRAAKRATDEIRRVLGHLTGILTPEAAGWYPGPEEFTKQVVENALDRFGKAFSRWRDLLAAAEQQRDAARRTMDDYSAPHQEKRAAQIRHAQAMDQLTLLQKGTTSTSNDFYTYRYLATEGFLPGYNFPRLPLMAYIPATADGMGRQTFLQRPRFLALSEFGPRSLVYHEGRAYRVERAMLSFGHRDGTSGDPRLPTQTARICKQCGGGHFDDEASMCHACGSPLGDAEVIHHVYRIENVATKPAERITANDEERQRQGFELQTTFQWAERDHKYDVERADAVDADGTIARFAYGPGATITRLNKGLRRRANKTAFGFLIDPVSGYWAKSDDEDQDDGPADPTVSPRQTIVPSVRDHKNALLVRPGADVIEMKTLATVQHAFLRGVEAEFQLEEGEILAEPVPTRDVRNGFLLYEATEGGAGVLTRLVTEPGAVATVARKALAIMHYQVEGDAGLPTDPSDLVDVPGTDCVAACYRCVMSYYNQPDHELLDRRDDDARTFLLRLARSTMKRTAGTMLDAVPAAPMVPTASPATASADPVVARWLETAGNQDLPAPDGEPLAAGDRQVPLVWRAHYVAALIGRPSEAVRLDLDRKGFDVVCFEPSGSDWPDTFRRLAAALGR